MPYIYMIRCTDQSLYTGITTDVGRRMQEHFYRKSSGAKYTRSHKMLSLEMVWETDNWSLAAKLEYRIKQMSKSKKELLLLHPEQADEIVSAGQQDRKVYIPHPDWKLGRYIKEKKGESSYETAGTAASFSDGT